MENESNLSEHMQKSSKELVEVPIALSKCEWAILQSLADHYGSDTSDVILMLLRPKAFGFAMGRDVLDEE
jgi:hypothetical protein